jgi:ferredoxin
VHFGAGEPVGQPYHPPRALNSPGPCGGQRVGEWYYTIILRIYPEEVSDLLVIDHTLCTACGVCPDVCPTGAIALDKDQRVATLDLVLCNECLACLDKCPTGAIQRAGAYELIPAVEGEIVESQVMPALATRPPLALGRSGRLAALAGMALTSAGNWLLPRAADALVGAIERRLVGGPTSAGAPLGSKDGLSTGQVGRARGGQSHRHRRRRRGQ